MTSGSTTQHHLIVGVSAIVGYQAVVSAYKAIRTHLDGSEKSDSRESRWVCPGVGAIGALIAAGVACRAVQGPGQDVKVSSAETSSIPALHDLLPRAVNLDPSHINEN